MEHHDTARIPLQLSRNCIVASIQVDLSDEVLRQFHTDLLELLSRTGAGGVILDVAGIEVLDLDEFEALKHTLEMAKLMGAKTIFSGFRAGVVAALVELEADIEGLVATRDLDSASEMLEVKPEPQELADPGETEETSVQTHPEPAFGEGTVDEPG